MTGRAARGRAARAALLTAAAVALVLLGVGSRWHDRDGDGAWGRWRAPVDCDDTDPAAHPGALELPLNGRDEDCDGFDSARGSNVLLITIDTLRARNLGAYGYSRDTSPNIDALARQGVLFLDAFAPSPWTLPSLASLLTSRYPHQHKMRMVRNQAGERGVTGVRPELPVLAEVLGAAGYETAFFFTSAYPLAEMDLDRGFDHVEEEPAKKTREIRRWLERHRQKPFFLWLHYFEPHNPYYPSARFDRLYIPEGVAEHGALAHYWEREECRAHYENPDLDVARIRMGFYDACIRESDSRVGEILAALDELDLAGRTLVVLSSDHGEEFFEHGGCDHGMTLWDEVLHVPLLFRHPLALPAGVRIPGQVRLLDVAPTILDLLEVPAPEGFVGESLVTHWRGEPRELPVFAGFLMSGEPVVALRQGGLKYLHEPQRHRDALYDLHADPRERENLVEARHHVKLRELRERTRAWLAGGSAAPARPVPLDSETLERLEALGYRLGPERAADPETPERR